MTTGARSELGYALSAPVPSRTALLTIRGGSVGSGQDGAQGGAESGVIRLIVVGVGRDP